MSPPLATQTVPICDIETAYWETGAGPPFVWVHGFTGAKLDFLNQLSWFADQRRLIAVDLRGHGESSHQAPYSFDQLAVDLLAFLDALDLMRIDLLGHSMGGMIAMRLAVEYPERVRSLVLMDTAPGPIEVATPTIRDQLADTVRDKGCDALVPMMKVQPPDAARQRGIDYLGQAEHWRRIAEKLGQMDPEAFIALADELANHDSYEGRLSEITCPTTVIVGEHDQPFLKPSQTMAHHIPDAQLIMVPAAAHSPQYENHEDWRAAIESHLSR